MTIRDIGTWLGNVWDRVLADLQIVVSSGPLDWPLWVFLVGFIVIFFLIPFTLGMILFAIRDYIEHEPPMGLGWCIGFTVAAVLCALVLVDLYLTKRLFDVEEPTLMFLYIGYPIMTVFFGFFAFIEWWKQIRIWRGR